MSVNITLPSMDKPLHIVVWQDSNVDGYSSNVTVLTERISKLEAAIERMTLLSSGTTGTLTSTATAVVAEKTTPLISGIDMKRMPESTGSLSAVNPPDVRNILYNLITQPPLSSINKYINPETPSSIVSYTGSIDNIEVNDSPLDLDADDEDSTINLVSAQEEDADDADAEDEVDVAEEGLEVEDDVVAEEGLEVEDDAPGQLEAEDDTDAAEEDADADAEDDADADAEGELEDDAPGELEEAEELQEFEYKGTTYWKDSQNQVYITDESGDLVDQPYGVWSDEKKKVLKYPK